MKYIANDCISREAVDRIINKWLSHPDYELKDHIYSMTEKIHNLPSVTPQEPTDKNFTKADIDAIVKAINKGWELRVKEILDKIRAEIEFEVDHRTNMLCAEDVFAILDKYKSETEDT